LASSFWTAALASRSTASLLAVKSVLHSTSTAAAVLRSAPVPAATRPSLEARSRMLSFSPSLRANSTALSMSPPAVVSSCLHFIIARPVLARSSFTF